MLKIQLVDPSSLSAWDKNPRKRDPERFEWIKMSLRKFGFVMPIYARSDGLLYSGHQRTAAALELGFKNVPVVFIPNPHDDQKSRALNILFNLCTNDHATRADYGRTVAMGLSELKQFEELPDAVNLYPCLGHFEIATMDYEGQITSDQARNSTAGFAKTLLQMGGMIPIVLDEADQMINGAPRLAAAIKEHHLSYPAVRVTENSAALQLFLNRITMSFDLKACFGEELRYNSFFRARNQGSQRTYLGVGFYGWVFYREANKGGKAWLKANMIRLEGDNLKRFVKEHGTVCIDFGAGRLDNTQKLQAAGLTCIPFEPYCLKPKTDQITVQGSRMVARSFLAFIKSQPAITSVFCSSVFNSVPFKEDRRLLMILFQALCCKGATLYLCTLGDAKLASSIFGNIPNARNTQTKSVLLDIEPGLYIGEIYRTAKVQKFYSKLELLRLGLRYFQDVDYVPCSGSSHGIRCRQPRPLELVDLVRAIEFEFDLPYPGDLRMGLVDEAIDAFSSFTGEDLQHVRKTCRNLLDSQPADSPKELQH